MNRKYSIPYKIVPKKVQELWAKIDVIRDRAFKKRQSIQNVIDSIKVDMEEARLLQVDPGACNSFHHVKYHPNSCAKCSRRREHHREPMKHEVIFR